MAEKGFGVKEVNLIGASGTPTITSPNNLNLNANNVAISTNVSIGGTLTVTGNVSVGGTLTYEDVTNIDSVGLITARSGLIISGVTTFNTDVDFKGSGGATKILYDASQDALEFADSATLAFGSHPGTGDYQINYVNGGDFAINAMSGGTQDLVIGRYESATQKKHLVSTRAGVIELYHDNAKKLETNSTGVNITGAITVNGSALSITPTNTDVQVVYTVTANGSSAYRFAGNGIVSTEDNPDVYLIRGLKYRFINNSGGSHPFQIRQSSGGSAYSSGVTNNGASSGNIDFQVPYSAPSHLYYQCTVHGGMVGNIYIRGAGGNNTNVGVTTLSSSATLHTNRILPTGGAPSGGGGGIVQIKSVTHTEFESQSLTGSGNFFDIAGMSVSITPKFNTSKIFVMATVAVACNSANKNNFIQLRRDSTDIAKGTEGGSVNASFYHKTRDNFSPANINIQHLDSPATTSAVTYKVRWSGENSTTYYLNRNASNTNEGMVSSITVMEVSG